MSGTPQPDDEALGPALTVLALVVVMLVVVGLALAFDRGRGQDRSVQACEDMADAYETALGTSDRDVRHDALMEAEAHYQECVGYGRASDD